MRRSRAVVWGLAVFGCVAFLAGCEKPDPVLLGFVGTLTGRGADLGVAGRNGAILAVEQRNAVGGVRGRAVKLLVRDDEQKTEVARAVVSELRDLSVTAIIGPMTSSMAMATVPLLQQSTATVMLSPTVTTKELSGRDDNFFRVISTTSEYAAKNARFQFADLGHRSAVAIYDLNNKAYTEGWLNDFRTTFEALGGRMLKTATFRSGEDSVFLEKVQHLLGFHPDLVVVIANAVDAALICQQVRKLDQRVAINLSEWAATERFIELGGAAAEGAYADQYFNRNDRSERFTSFLTAYRERFNLEPGFAGVAAYDAATVALDALATRRPGQSLRDVILSTPSFQGVQQTIVFDRFGDARRQTYLSTIRNGRFVTVE